MAIETSLSAVFPLGSRLNERGRLEVGGCDTIELAREFGTPAYVVAEEDLLWRARAFTQAGRDAGHRDFQVVFASKAFPCTAVLALFAREGLWCDVASGGELYLALERGLSPGADRGPRKRQVRGRAAHGAAPPRGADRGRQLRRDRPAGAARWQTARSPTAGGGQPVLVRVTPDVSGETHEKISTGQADSKFGFAMADAGDAIARLQAVEGLSLQGLHAHIGSQLLGLEPFRREADELAKLGEFPVWDLGGGLGAQYTEDQPPPPSIEEYVGAIVGAAHARGMGSDRRLMIEPGRALCANAGVTLYTVESVKQNVSRWVAVDGGMSDNMRPMLYGAPYEAHVADRFGRRADRVQACGQALRVRRRDRAQGAAGGPEAGRRDSDARHGRLRLRDGKQLQRRAAAAGGLLPGR